MCQSNILNLVALEPRVETNFVRVGKQNLGHEELMIEVVKFYWGHTSSDIVCWILPDIFFGGYKQMSIAGFNIKTRIMTKWGSFGINPNHAQFFLEKNVL